MNTTHRFSFGLVLGGAALLGAGIGTALTSPIAGGVLALAGLVILGVRGRAYARGVARVKAADRAAWVARRSRVLAREYAYALGDGDEETMGRLAAEARELTDIHAYPLTSPTDIHAYPLTTGEHQ